MNVTVVTATSLEANAARKYAPPGTRVVQAGIALVRERDFGEAALSCGIAGGLQADLPTGTVLIPSWVRAEGVRDVECDAQLREALLRAASAQGFSAVEAPLITTAELVHGERRAQLARDGFAGVDMETALIRTGRLACVRVILDTPVREIHPAWAKAASLPLYPRAWLDLPFLMREGPRCARIAAMVAGEAIRETGSS